MIVPTAFAYCAFLFLLSCIDVWSFLANSALRIASRSLQLQAQEDRLDKSSGLQLKHAQANVLAELSAIKLAQDELDSALRFALRGTKIDLDLPTGTLHASRASAALAAAASQA